jgi:hypothetical protein
MKNSDLSLLLLVEPDDAIREFLDRSLTRFGFRTLGAKSVADALALRVRHPEVCAIVACGVLCRGGALSIHETALLAVLLRWARDGVAGPGPLTLEGVRRALNLPVDFLLELVAAELGGPAPAPVAGEAIAPVPPPARSALRAVRLGHQSPITLRSHVNTCHSHCR